MIFGGFSTVGVLLLKSDELFEIAFDKLDDDDVDETTSGAVFMTLMMIIII